MSLWNTVTRQVATALVTMGLVWWSTPAHAQENFPHPEEKVSVGDFGGIGLLEMRTARFGPDGLFNIGYSRVEPYKRYALSIQILPGLEATFRYTEIRNRLYSNIATFSGTQTYKDRGADLKLRLWKESRYFPAVAIGLQDTMGTGIFAGEYLVASKRYRDLDFTLGMGWGYVGSRGSIKNPMTIISPIFLERTPAEGLGGVPALSSLFSGKTVGIFGGIEYNTPIEGLSLKLEYDSHEYTSEALENTLPDTGPINFGINFRPAPWIDFGYGFERSRRMLRVTLRSNFNADGIPNFDPPPPSIETRPQLAQLMSDGVVAIAPDTGAVAPPQSADPAMMVFNFLEDSGLLVTDISIQSNSLIVHILTQSGVSNRPDLERIAAGILGSLPSDIAEISLVHDAMGITSKAQRNVKSPADAADSMFQTLAIMGLDISSVELDGALARVTVLPLNPAVVLDFSQVARVVSGALGLAEATIVDGRTGNTQTWVDFGSRRRGAPQAVGVLVTNVGHSRPLLPPVDPDYSPDEREAVAVQLANALESQAFFMEALEMSGRQATVYLTPVRFRQVARNIGFSARIIANVLPAPIEEITIVSLNGGMEVSRVMVLRSDLERADKRIGSPEEILARAEITTGYPWWPGSSVQVPGRYPRFSWFVAPQTRQHIGGPDQFILYQFWLSMHFFADIARGLSLSGIAGKNLYNNFDKIKLTSDSVLPKVRSNIKEYLQKGNDNLVRLQLDYMFKAAEDLYVRTSAGIFEEMFGGIGAEILYRPFDSRLAIGLDVNRIHQRTFEQRLKFQDYKVTTGFLSFYYNIPYKDLLGVVSAGTYLAGDRGVTLDLSRRFDSGVRVGAWATRTTVPFNKLGEGSFDKGFYFVVPFELLFTNSTTSSGVFGFRPLFREGGQRLLMANRLIEITGGASYGEVIRDWPQFFK
jgi:hypothetical protein